MADIRARQEDGVLDLDGLADVALVADGRGAADIAVRADLAVIADDDVALDDDARQDFGAFADLQASVDIERRVCAGFLSVSLTGRHRFDIRPQQVPGVGDGEGLAGAQFAAAAFAGDQDDAVRSRHAAIGDISDEGRQFCGREPGRGMNGQIGISSRNFRQSERQQGRRLVAPQRDVSQGEVTERPREGQGVATGRLSGFSEEEGGHLRGTRNQPPRRT